MVITAKVLSMVLLVLIVVAIGVILKIFTFLRNIVKINEKKLKKTLNRVKVLEKENALMKLEMTKVCQTNTSTSNKLKQKIKKVKSAAVAEDFDLIVDDVRNEVRELSVKVDTLDDEWVLRVMKNSLTDK